MEALPPIGKEYHQRYKLVNDRLPKQVAERVAQQLSALLQWEQQMAEQQQQQQADLHLREQQVAEQQQQADLHLREQQVAEQQH
ncbi:hypothetical protein HaLaN_11144 [Haematococcus lacustris]|uniref:Uncharacterized protein n=1 Tax=Haematococcus lacustris TaxID=44745 RepID=A0A699Z6R5_HAELA|nr:hypothetical protein HaLaN_11144 [Haematococcus lacustris]